MWRSSAGRPSPPWRAQSRTRGRGSRESRRQPRQLLRRRRQGPRAEHCYLQEIRKAKQAGQARWRGGQGREGERRGGEQSIPNRAGRLPVSRACMQPHRQANHAAILQASKPRGPANPPTRQVAVQDVLGVEVRHALRHLAQRAQHGGQVVGRRQAAPHAHPAAVNCRQAHRGGGGGQGAGLAERQN
jgi:hypothetical protein